MFTRLEVEAADKIAIAIDMAIDIVVLRSLINPSTSHDVPVSVYMLIILADVKIRSLTPSIKIIFVTIENLGAEHRP
jgi:hypothetical protein